MCDQNAVELAEAQPRMQDLALRAFTAVHQETVFVVDHHLRGQTALDGRRGSGSAQEYNFKQ